ncbi:hypothetical protein EV651_1143 [Kribbella sp. VKM Ac-2571]|nr:hypothetical protein EV651_1143 [Kribbella sp. VKM Ac-2571]
MGTAVAVAAVAAAKAAAKAADTTAAANTAVAAVADAVGGAPWLLDVTGVAAGLLEVWRLWGPSTGGGA